MSACAAAPVWPCAAAYRLCMHCLAALGWHTCPCSSTTPCLMEAQPRADPGAFCQALPAASSLLVTLCPALSADAPAAPCPAAPSCECAPSSCRLHCELHLTIAPTPACLQNPSANYQFSCRHPSMLNPSVQSCLTPSHTQLNDQLPTDTLSHLMQRPPLSDICPAASS